MFYPYICYWNTFQYKCIVQITFDVVKQSYALQKGLWTLDSGRWILDAKWYIILCLIYFGFIECLYMNLF